MHLLQSRITSQKLYNVFSSRQCQHKFLAIYKSQSGDEDLQQNKTYLYQIPPWMKKYNEKEETLKKDNQQTFNEISIQEGTKCKSIYKIKRRLSPIPKKTEIQKVEEDLNDKKPNERLKDQHFLSSPLENEKDKESNESKTRQKVFFSSIEKLKDKNESNESKKKQNFFSTIKENLKEKNESNESKTKQNFFSSTPPVESPFKVLQTKNLKFPPRADPFPAVTELFHYKEPLSTKKFETKNQWMVKKDNEIRTKTENQTENNKKEESQVHFEKKTFTDKKRNFLKTIKKVDDIIKQIDAEKDKKEILRKIEFKKAQEIDKNVKEMLRKKNAINALKDENIPEKNVYETKKIDLKKITLSPEIDKIVKLKQNKSENLENEENLVTKHFDFLFPKSVEDKRKVWCEILKLENESEKPPRKTVYPNLRFSSKEMLFSKSKVKENQIDPKNTEIAPKQEKNEQKLEKFNKSINNLRKEGERLRIQFEKNKKKLKKRKLNAVLHKVEKKEPKVITKRPRKRKILRKNVRLCKNLVVKKIEPKPKVRKTQIKNKILSNWTSQIPERLVVPKFSSRTVFDNNFTKPEEKEVEETVKIRENEVKINEIKDRVLCIEKPKNDERKFDFERLPKQIKDALVRIHSDNNKSLEYDVINKKIEEKKDEKALIKIDKPKIKIEPTVFNLQKVRNIISKYKCCFRTAIRAWDMSKKINNEKQKSSILIFGGGKLLNKIKNQKRIKNGKCASGYRITMKNKTLLHELQTRKEKKILLPETPKPKKNIILRNSKHKKNKKTNKMTKIKKKIEIKEPVQEVKIDPLAPGMSYSEILSAVFSSKSIAAHFKK